MKNSFFSRFTPKEPKFFPLLKQLSEILLSSSALLIEILGHDSPEKRAEDYKRIKDLEREGDKLTNLILDELGTTFITPFDREDIHDLASGMDDVIDGINSCAKRITIYNRILFRTRGKSWDIWFNKKRPSSARPWMNWRHSARVRISCAHIATSCMT